ncbi:MAG: hypothetical protein Q8J74_09180 [Candidatus Didemnitutus sp.]|nr:hypothetical protein [Candidatus Didemnitutus sp.]
MASLAQLLASHGRILVIDAASTNVHVGLLRLGELAIWRQSPDEAGKAVFVLVEACLQEAHLNLVDVPAFAYCAGPGSMLGIRTVVMALRTWQGLVSRPSYHYLSLALLAHELARQGKAAPFAVIADARRETWHVNAVDADRHVQPLQRVTQAELAAGDTPLWQSAAFRAWSDPPRDTHDTPYQPAALFGAQIDTDLLALVEPPDVFQHAAPEYKKWTAQVHRAATAHPK